MKRISTKIGIIIFVAVVILAVGGILVWQYGWIGKSFIPTPTLTPVVTPTPTSTATNLNLTTTKLVTVPKEQYVFDFIFSPNGRRVAYLTQEKGEYFLILDGKEEIPFYGSPTPGESFTFSPDSQHFAYLQYNEETGGLFLVIDGKEESQSYRWVESFTFSPDSQHLAYGAEKKATGYSKGGYFMVLDGKENQSYEYFAKDPTFSPDNQHLAYIAYKEGKRFIVLDSKESQSYDYIYNPTFSPDSQHLAYSALKEGKRFVVLDGKEIKTYGGGYAVSYFAFSPDSQHFAYIVDRGSEWEEGRYFLVLDDKESQSYNYISNPTFSPDSQHFIYVAEKKGKYFIVLDGKEESQSYDYISNPTFSPDSQHLAYIIEKEKRYFLVLDGKEGQVYDDIDNPTFSPDNKYLSYGVRISNEFWWIVEEVEKFGKTVIPTPISTPPSTLDETANWRTYRNEDYKFEFKHPPYYILREYNTITLETKTKGLSRREDLEIYIRGDGSSYMWGIDTTNMSFEEFAIEMIQEHCYQEGVHETIDCTDVTEIKPYYLNNITGYEIYITEVHTASEKKIRGPIFVFDISQQTQNLALSRGIFFQLSRGGTASSEKESLLIILRQILSTLKFIK